MRVSTLLGDETYADATNATLRNSTLQNATTPRLQKPISRGRNSSGFNSSAVKSGAPSTRRRYKDLNPRTDFGVGDTRNTGTPPLRFYMTLLLVSSAPVAQQGCPVVSRERRENSRHIRATPRRDIVELVLFRLTGDNSPQIRAFSSNESCGKVSNVEFVRLLESFAHSGCGSNGNSRNNKRCDHIPTGERQPKDPD